MAEEGENNERGCGMKWMDEWQEMRLSPLGARWRGRSRRRGFVPGGGPAPYSVHAGLRFGLWPWCAIGMLAVALFAVLGWFFLGAS